MMASAKIAAWVGASTLVVLAGACAGKTIDDDESASDGGAADAQAGADSGYAKDAGPRYVKPGEVPKHHYPGGSSCRPTRPPGVDLYDAGGYYDCEPSDNTCCASDADCVDGGANGRCEYERYGAFCTYDECATSSDCPTNEGCACGDLNAASANACVSAKCRVDDDCGPGGFCSPSPYAYDCGQPQYEAIFCHTPNDVCYDDSDCPQVDGGPTFRCSFSQESGYWTCQQESCAG